MFVIKKFLTFVYQNTNEILVFDIFSPFYKLSKLKKLMTVFNRGNITKY